MTKQFEVELQKLKPEEVVKLNRILDDQFQGVRSIVEIMSLTEERFDALVGIRQVFMSMDMSITVAQAQQIAADTKTYLDKIIKVLDKNITSVETCIDDPAKDAEALLMVTPSLSEFCTTTWKNPIDHIVTELQDKIGPDSEWLDVCTSFIIFNSVKNAGQKFEDIHQRIMDEYMKLSNKGSVLQMASPKE